MSDRHRPELSHGRIEHLPARRTLAAVSLVLHSLTACDRSVGGTALPGAEPPSSTTAAAPSTSTPTRPAPNQQLTAILPDADQWLWILGRQPELTPVPVQGVDALGRQDLLGDWSNPQCLGVVHPALESVFTAAPVDAVLNGYPVFETSVAVSAYQDEATAGTLFAPMADRWRQCTEKTVTDSSMTPPVDFVIGDVSSAPTVASTTLTIPGNYRQVFQRAVAQAGRCLLDVSVPETLDGPGPTTPADAATALVAVMQDRAAAATC